MKYNNKIKLSVIYTLQYTISNPCTTADKRPFIVYIVQIRNKDFFAPIIFSMCVKIAFICETSPLF